MDNNIIETENNGTVSSIIRACDTDIIIIGLSKIPKAFIELTLEE